MTTLIIERPTSLCIWYADQAPGTTSNHSIRHHRSDTPSHNHTPGMAHRPHQPSISYGQYDSPLTMHLIMLSIYNRLMIEPTGPTDQMSSTTDQTICPARSLECPACLTTHQAHSCGSTAMTLTLSWVRHP